jgi:hypothetical protein
MRHHLRSCDSGARERLAGSGAAGPVNTGPMAYRMEHLAPHAWHTTINNATVRLMARVTISGDALRVRLANTFGAEPLHIAKAYVGLRTQGAGLVAGSNRQILFDGASAVMLAAGATVTSDQIAMSVMAGQDVAISLYLPGAGVHPTQHTLAFTTSYSSADNSGDMAADEGRSAFTATLTSMY